MAQIKQSETKIVSRSNIHFAPYNPRKKNKDVVEALKKNFKKVGYLGGIVWNERTGNIVGGHKRIEAMDLIHNYTGRNDYDIKLEVIDVDEKTEKEQNIFLNNKRVQGDMDYELLASFLPEIDIQNTGLTQYDIDIVKAIAPNIDFGDINDIKKDIIEQEKPYNDRKESIKKLKQDIKNNVSQNQTQTHFNVVFETYEQKAEFLEMFNFDADSKIIDGENLLERIQNG